MPWAQVIENMTGLPLPAQLAVAERPEQEGDQGAAAKTVSVPAMPEDDDWLTADEAGKLARCLGVPDKTIEIFALMKAAGVSVDGATFKRLCRRGLSHATGLVT